MVKNNEINEERLNIILTCKLKDNFRQYESLSTSLNNAVVFINDLDAGVLNLGQVCNPNKTPNSSNLSLLLDNLFTFGSEYMDDHSPFVAMEHRKQRLKSIKQVIQIIKTLNKSKYEIKCLQCRTREDSLKQLSIACLSIVLKFFEGLKKQLKKSESLIKFNAIDVGHLIPLTIGHKNKPTDSEIAYTKTIMKLSDFKYDKHNTAPVGPSPLIETNKSSLLPKVQPSPDRVAAQEKLAKS